jgi:predicted AlkP superfamily phosphohydrolase/phosphomutase
MAEAPRVLAIALDAAEPAVLRRMMGSGEMPALARLAERSAFLRVAAEPYVGSGPLWPSFITGLEPERHRRLYGPWLWDPEEMRIAPQPEAPLTPMWDGSSIGLFDVPMAPACTPPGGFAIRGWGSHHPMDLEHSVWPPDAEPLLGERHPFECAHEINFKAGNRVEELSRLGSDALRGLPMRGGAARRLLSRFRPEVAFVHFHELHRCGHWMWQTLEPDDKLYASLPEAVRSLPVGLAELYREADRQVGLLIEEAGAEANVFVFGLHGMEPASGIPDLLRPVLIGSGYARIANVRAASLPGRALANLKAHAPAAVKRAYYATMPRELTLRLANLLPDYDWPATRAFAIPSEEFGWIRLNVAGREAAGIVAPGDYGATCDELEEMLRSLTSPSGEALVTDVGRTDIDNILPDLVVHWGPAAHGEVARLGEREFHAEKLVPWLTGQHTTEGFCLMPPRSAGRREWVAPAELQELMLSAGLSSQESSS